MSNLLNELPDGAERLLEESRSLRARRVATRELIAEGTAAALFLACAVALAVGAGGVGAIPPLSAALLVTLYAIVSSIKFPVGAGYVVPSQLVLVPMLVLLPPATVPLLVAAGLFTAAAGGWLRRRAQPRRIVFSVADSWHSLGPALVLVLAGFGSGSAGIPSAPVLLLAFAAACIVDLTSGILREAAALGIAPRVQIRVIALAWIADACLAPIGLLAALATTNDISAVLMVLPLAALLMLIARDRNGRIERAQLQLELVRHERSRLQSAVRRMGEAFAAKLDLDALLDIVLRGSVEALDASGGRLVLDAPDGQRLIEYAPDDDIAEALRSADRSHGGVWTLGMPLTIGATGGAGQVRVARRDRPFQDDEVELLRELVERAAGAAADIVTHHELREQAFTDALTGLGNRRRLRADLERRCAPAAADQPSLLMLFDLDGFKRYNDTFGHPAGDALLERLAAKLVEAVAPSGTAYRLGGDEFCVLMDVEADLDHAITAAAGALTESGEEFSIGASYGAVLLPHEGQSPDQAIQCADERMYASKRGTSSSPREQASHVLMRTMHAKQPSLEDHSSEVAALAVAVARRLGVRGEGLDEVMRAAELHDIGKVGIPDAILEKPGPLDRAEWEFMHQHTILGERILLAAPALRPIASIVRTSHERWDGAGYPDGLGGEQIPLAARIVAVCDAFEAMTSDRSYRRAMSRAAACSELRAMAGSQFDPEVIAVFLEEMGHRDGVNASHEPDAGFAAVHAISMRVQELLGHHLGGAPHGQSRIG